MANPSIPHLKFEAEQAVDHAAESRPVEILARLGYASRGFVHLVIGALAVRLAMGDPGGKAIGSHQAVSELGRAGRVPLGFVAVGLLGFGVWRFVQAFADTEAKGKKLKGIAKRVQKLVNGLIHVGLAVLAAKLVMGMHTDTSDHTPRYVAQVMEHPLGRWAVAIFGGGLIGGGVSQIIKSIRAKFAKNIEYARGGWRTATIVLGRIGYALRALVFVACGALMIKAAAEFDPNQARNLGGALSSLREQPYGGYLFGAVAFGILAYALFSFLYAEFRHIGHKEE
jgi:hypothetical protein